MINFFHCRIDICFFVVKNNRVIDSFDGTSSLSEVQSILSSQNLYSPGVRSLILILIGILTFYIASCGLFFVNFSLSITQNWVLVYEINLMLIDISQQISIKRACCLWPFLGHIYLLEIKNTLDEGFCIKISENVHNLKINNFDFLFTK